MNLEFTAEQQAFREQIRTWLTETLPPEFAAKVRHGRVLNKTEQEQVARFAEFARLVGASLAC